MKLNVKLNSRKYEKNNELFVSAVKLKMIIGG